MKRMVRALLVILAAILVTSTAKTVDQTGEQTTKNISATVDLQSTIPKTIKYVSLGVPNINSSFKTWMNYKAVTDSNSPQYKFIHTYGWVDEEGFMRCYTENELEIEQDYYMIALGSHYGTEIGTKYRITLDTGKVFYGVLADCKDDKHTDPSNQYIPHNGNVVEFLVEKTNLNKNVRKTGNVSAYTPLKGNIIKIEKIIF